MTLPEIRCPGQDQRYWKPEDIFVCLCPQCGAEIEFFKDEPFLYCHDCSGEVRNPRMDLGCAKWCKHADKCLGVEMQPNGTPARKSVPVEIQELGPKTIPETEKEIES